MRRLLIVVSVFAFGTVGVAVGADRSRTISTARVSIRIPATWHAVTAKTPSCDPDRLVAVSSAPIRIGRTGKLARPPHGNVLIFLMEDRYRRDRPSGDLKRPAHFSITWDRLVRLKLLCGSPNAPASMRYFKTHGRYIGFIVYPTAQIDSRIRAMTLALMDSLRVHV